VGRFRVNDATEPSEGLAEHIARSSRAAPPAHWCWAKRPALEVPAIGLDGLWRRVHPVFF
jgi:hypothetical protein